MLEDRAKLTPKEIVAELDKHIIGQVKAKRSVAIALRNRWRRSQIAEPLQTEIKPKNILLIGPTGVGKTEIARRLANLSDAPFIKVEATSFTEVGYVGRDVEAIIRDLMDLSVKREREKSLNRVQARAKEAAVKRILAALLPQPPRPALDVEAQEQIEVTRETFTQKILNGELDDSEIELDMACSSIGVEIMAPPGMEEVTDQIQNMLTTLSAGKTKRKKLKVRNALQRLTEEEASNLVNEEEVRAKAKLQVEQNGIVFIDEIDKVARRANFSGVDVSREGVQRDLLPLIEGTAVSTKYGIVHTDHILFIASGAFQLAKPSDLVPELQGRFPIRVELTALQTEDFIRILTEPKASLVEQYEALMAVEGVKIKFTELGLKRIAEVAFQVNEKTENIGARRLYTIMERLLEEVSFEGCSGKRVKKSVTIDQTYVNSKLQELAENDDLSRYIL